MHHCHLLNHLISVKHLGVALALQVKHPWRSYKGLKFVNVHERKHIEAVKMNCLRNICGVRRINKVRNEEIWQRCRKKVGLSVQMNQRILRWFSHVERVEDDNTGKEGE